MRNPYIIGISSQKGGVGKTTISVNLSVALRSLNYRVLLIDADTTNPSVGFHMGLDKANTGYRDVVYGRANLRDAIAIHSPTGLHVLPGTLNTKQFSPPSSRIDSLGGALRNSNYDFIMFDTAPGSVELDISKYYDEALILTTPEMSACTSSMRLANRYNQMKIIHNLAVNRVRNKRYEISLEEIEEIYEKKVRGTLPEDDIVPISISQHIPAYVLGPDSRFSKGIRSMAKKYASSDSRLTMGFEDMGVRARIASFLKRLFGLRLR
ncbi:MAG: MinD/ParA family protein [Candidatus Micrarchaeota archaeon]|nr:MinD/ParA family protein [Candidatus Micrarchaeota archaeon]